MEKVTKQRAAKSADDDSLQQPGKAAKPLTKPPIRPVPQRDPKHGEHKSRQSSRVVRPKVEVTAKAGGKRGGTERVMPKQAFGPGTQDVVIYKDSYLTETGGRKYTPLDSVTIPALLAAIASTGNLTLSCERLNISRLQVYSLKKEKPEFKEQLFEAQRIGIEAWKDEAARRAFVGWDRPIYQQGLQVGAERQFSDSLALAMLKAGDPENFGDRSRIDHSVVGANGEVQAFNELSDIELSDAITSKLRILSSVARTTASPIIDVKAKTV